MIYSLRVSSEAEKELAEAVSYYDEVSTELADRFLNAVGQAFEKIKNNPQFYSYISAQSQSNFRDIKLDSFPYVVVFEINNEQVIVASVMNTHRQQKER